MPLRSVYSDSEQNLLDTIKWQNYDKNFSDPLSIFQIFNPPIVLLVKTACSKIWNSKLDPSKNKDSQNSVTQHKLMVKPAYTMIEGYGYSCWQIYIIASFSSVERDSFGIWHYPFQSATQLLQVCIFVHPTISHEIPIYQTSFKCCHTIFEKNILININAN